MAFPKKQKTIALPAVRRTAGQSIRDEKERIFTQKLMPLYFATVGIWGLWLAEKMGVQPTPRSLLWAAILSTGICAFALRRAVPQFRNLNRGEIGEMHVAEALDELRAEGYRVVHDLPQDGFNVDHVLVGPGGVFAVETKFRSGYGEIECRNGEGLLIGGQKEPKDSVKQACGAAKAVHDLIKKDAGHNIWVRPLVVFVGDWKIKNAWRNTDARILTVNQIAHYICQQQPELTRDEIQLISSHLERTVRLS